MGFDPRATHATAKGSGHKAIIPDGPPISRFDVETETVCTLEFLGIQNFGGKAGVLWWNPTKNDRNIRERGISFADAQHIEYDTAVVSVDDRKDYGEVREVLAGFIGARLHILVFTRRGETCWVISLRKANKREIQAYVEALD